MPEGRMFVHSQAAIDMASPRFPVPANRVFLVVKTDRDGFMVAWTCTLTRQGLIHPAFIDPLPLTEHGLERGRVTSQALNGSGPSGIFKFDSFHVPVTLNDLVRLAQELK